MRDLDPRVIYHGLEIPSADTLLRFLPEIGDGLHAQLADLSAHPCVDKCERVLTNLEGARLHLQRIRERLLAGDELA